MSDAKSLEELHLPKTLTETTDNIIAGIKNLEEANAKGGEGLKTIGSYAFKDINKVTNLIIPTTVTSMGAGLFSGMSALEELTIPFVGRDKTIYSIGSNESLPRSYSSSSY